jgi:hypothetical protein
MYVKKYSNSPFPSGALPTRVQEFPRPASPNSPFPKNRSVTLQGAECRFNALQAPNAKVAKVIEGSGIGSGSVPLIGLSKKSCS